jgi:2'-5' RNA ligase
MNSTAHPARHRIFVAVLLSPALLERVLEVRERLGEAAARLRWVAPENLHLTLRFLGALADAQVARVVEAAREAAAAASPFEITLAGMGAFPSGRAPRAVWVGVADGADRLVALAASLEAALRRRRLPPADRPFRPHLTVARVRGEGRPVDLSAVLPGPEACPIGTQRVDVLAVVESTLRPSGPIYREVARGPLGAGAEI